MRSLAVRSLALTIILAIALAADQPPKTISKPPGRAYVSGVWRYSPPRTLDNEYEYGQYVYSPADIRGCRRNLTFHVAGAAFDACRPENTPDSADIDMIYGPTRPAESYVYLEYFQSYECIPDALMLAARTVDYVNEKRLIDIPGTVFGGLTIHHHANALDSCALSAGSTWQARASKSRRTTTATPWSRTTRTCTTS